MPRLENWKVCEKPKQEFIAPEFRKKFLAGNVFGHPRFTDGSQVSTSPLISINLERTVAKTRNTEYELGEIDPEYKEWCRENKIGG